MAKRKILIVDDEASVRGLLVGVLSAPETEVWEAEDGVQALQLARQQGLFDVVITDIRMPGIDGLEMARHLRRGRNAHSFLFVSGYAQLDSIDQVLGEFERAEFLNKPFTLHELLRTVDMLCEQSPIAFLEPSCPPAA
jgi:CheY-like chemotaxis protein